MTTEYVLAIPRTELTKQNVGTNGIYDFNLNAVQQDLIAFLPRDLVDNKSDTSIEIGKLLPQILGYFQITDSDGRILTYRRKGKEKGLLGKYSIGVGGHVDINDSYNVGMNLRNLVEFGSERELGEEINLTEFIFNPTKIISTYVDPTSTVHVGLPQEIHIDEKGELEYSDDEFPGVEWYTKEELKELSKTVEFETWSQLLIDSY